MDTKEFIAYLKLFEREVIEVGVFNGYLGPLEMVHVRGGRLSGTPYGKALGKRSPSQIPFVIDYYGHFKRSNGFERIVRKETASIGTKSAQVKMIQCPVVHFAALKIDEIHRITKNHEVLAGFPAFKDKILRLRGFRKGEE